MTLKYLITTRFSPTEVMNKYAVYDGPNRLRVQAGHTQGHNYVESKAEKDMKAQIGGLVKGIRVQSMPDPSDHHFVLFEVLKPVKLEIEI